MLWHDACNEKSGWHDACSRKEVTQHDTIHIRLESVTQAAKQLIWPRGVTASTLDPESSNRGSNPREALDAATNISGYFYTAIQISFACNRESNRSVFPACTWARKGGRATNAFRRGLPRANHPRHASMPFNFFWQACFEGFADKNPEQATQQKFTRGRIRNKRGAGSHGRQAYPPPTPTSPGGRIWWGIKFRLLPHRQARHRGVNDN